MSIQNGAVLVEFGVSDWKASVVDKSVAAKIARDYRAGEQAGRYHKDLLAGSNFRRQISLFAQNMRNYHGKHTLPWQDRGARLLPLSMLQDYKDYMTAMMRQLEAMIEEFTNDNLSPNFYLNQKELAKSAITALGDMYREEDYPTLDEVRSMYSIRLNFMPVPESGDFRVDAPAQELDFLKSQYEDMTKQRVAQAQKDLWNRLFDRLTMARGKIGDLSRYYEAKANGEKTQRAILQDDYLDTLRDLCHLLGKLNVTGDAKLDKARRELADAFEGIDGEDLKEDAGCREDIEKKLEKIQREYW